MPQSPRLTDTESQTTKRPRTPQSASMLLLATALDTTWRAFLPTIGGTFLGIGIDHWFNIAPIGTIACLIVGTALSILLIAKQIRDVRKPL
ncbi:MAG: AtpZ/AtpI family protein [Candidatus Microsaccharimonas sp.]